MADPPPIQQRISIDADTRGVDEVSRGLDRVEQETQDTAAAALASARASGELDNQLRDLTATQRSLAEVEVDHQAKVAAGEAVTESEAQASAERQAQLRGLTAALTAEADRQEQINRLVAESATTTATAAAGEATREDRLRQLRGELESLIRDQDRYERSTQQGERATEAAEAAERDRVPAIDRLSREIAQAEDEQARHSRSMRDAVAAHRQLDDQGESTTQGLGRLADGLGVSTTALAGMAAGIIGPGGVALAYREWIQDIETANQRLQENAEIVRRNAEARLDLVALRGVEDPQEVARLDTLAAFAGRSPGEVARAGAVVESQLATATDQQKDALLVEASAAAQTSTAPVSELLKPLLAIFRQLQTAQASGDIAPAVDIAKVAGNLFQESIKQAGEDDPARLGQEIGKFIGVATSIGGLDVGQAAGFAAAGTSLGLPNEEATTGLKNVLFALRGKGTPEGREVLDREGIDTTDVSGALRQIAEARASDQISDAELESLGGREAAPVFAALSDPARLDDFLSRVEQVSAAGRRSDRISTGKAEGIFTADSLQGLNLQSKQEESREESVRAGDQTAARADTAKAILQRLLAEREASGLVTPALSQRITAEFEAQLAQGRDVEYAIEEAEATPDTDLTFRNPFGNLTSFSPAALTGDSSSANRGRSNFLRDPLLAALAEGPQLDAPEAGDQPPAPAPARDQPRRAADASTPPTAPEDTAPPTAAQDPAPPSPPSPSPAEEPPTTPPRDAAAPDPASAPGADSAAAAPGIGTPAELGQIVQLQRDAFNELHMLNDALRALLGEQTRSNADQLNRLASLAPADNASVRPQRATSPTAGLAFRAGVNGHWGAGA